MELEPELFSNQIYVKYEHGKFLVSWLQEVQRSYKLYDSTMAYALEIIRRTLKKMNIPLGEFQLVGITCLMIACKYDDDSEPLCPELCVYLCDDAYPQYQVIDMEKVILQKVLNYIIPQVPH